MKILLYFLTSLLVVSTAWSSPGGGKRKNSAYEKFLVTYKSLQKPFFAPEGGDPAAKEKAAIQLMKLIEKGPPEGCKPTTWSMHIGSIIEYQGCSQKAMEHAIGNLKKWVSDQSVDDQHLVQALVGALGWGRRKPISVVPKLPDNFDELISSAETLFDRLDGGRRTQLIWNLELAEIPLVTENRVAMARAVDDQKLSELIDRHIAELRKEGAPTTHVMMPIGKRIEAHPSSLELYSKTVRLLLKENPNDVFGQLSLMKAVVKVGEKGALPDWMGDEELAKLMRNVRGSKAQPGGRNHAQYDKRLLRLIEGRARSKGDVDLSAYQGLLSDMVVDEKADAKDRASALGVMFENKMRGSETLKKKYSKHPEIAKFLAKDGGDNRARE